MEEKKETQIDFVIAWVDGGDPAWQRERDRYGKMGEKTAAEETGEREKSGVACDTRDVRYRDWTAAVLVPQCGTECPVGAQDLFCHMGACAEVAEWESSEA